MYAVCAIITGSVLYYTHKLLQTYSACVSSSLNNSCAYYHLLTIFKKRDSILSILLGSLLTVVDCSCSLRAPGVRVVLCECSQWSRWWWEGGVGVGGM